LVVFFFSSRRRHTRSKRDWSSDVCSSDLFHMSPEPGVYYGVYDAAGLPLLEKVLKSFPNLPVIAHSQPFWYEMTPVSSAAPAERSEERRCRERVARWEVGVAVIGERRDVA